MKKIIAAVGLCIASASSQAAFVDGNELMQWSNSFDSVFNARDTRGKTTDVTNTINASKFVGYVMSVTDTAGGIAVCPPANTSREQVVAIVQKYMRANPENWNLSAAILALDALSTAFPCKKK